MCVELGCLRLCVYALDVRHGVEVEWGGVAEGQDFEVL